MPDHAPLAAEPASVIIVPFRKTETMRLVLATVGVGYPLFRMLVPSLAMALLVIPPLLLLLWLVWRTGQPRQTVRSPLALPLLLCAAALVASSFLGVAEGADRVAILFFWGGAMGVVLFLAIDLLASGWSPHLFLQAILATVTILLADASWEVVSRWVSWLETRQAGDSLLPPYISLDVIGMHHTAAVMPFVLGIPLAIAAMWRSERVWERWGWGIWLFWAVVVIFSTSARGGWLATIAAAGTILLPLLWSAYRAGQFRRLWATVFLSGGYVLLFIVLFVVNYAEVSQTVSLAPPAPGEEAPDFEEAIESLANPTGRLVFWERALQVFAERPLLGAGPGGYPARYDALAPARRVYTPPHAHNIYLAFLCELGLVGTVAFLALALMAGRVGWHGWHAMAPHSHERLWLLASGAVVVGMAVNGLVDVPPPQNGALIFSTIVAGLAYGGCWHLTVPPLPSPPTATLTLRSFLAFRPRDLLKVHPLHLLLVATTFIAWGVATLVFLQR
ncbi:MAG: hypothetical protein HC884_09790 [Chloroflexaceae bacterium]|nr:hypothetical protein [Chloroflexaceae bacterium]